MLGLVRNAQQKVYEQHWSLTTLRVVITLWSVGVIFLAWFVLDNPWLLAGLFAYEALP